MPRTAKKVPSYCRHKHSGRAVVRTDSRDHYLGEYGSPESYEKYERLIAEWRVVQAESATTTEPPNSSGCSRRISVNELILQYWKFAETYYVKDGAPTKELACMRDAIRPLRRLYGRYLAVDFGPLGLKAIRQHMIDSDLSRGVINHRINRIKRVIKWAVSEELIPPSVYEGLRCVTGLRKGRTTARETEPVRPVAIEHVDAVLAYVAPQIAAMIELQKLTGMRPCEVTIMRPCDIDRSESIWIYQPTDHKSAWRGHGKTVPLGPKAQAVLKPFLDRADEVFLFSPKEATEWRKQRRPVHYKSKRKTPVYPSELKRREKVKQIRKKRKPKRPYRGSYNTDSYRRAIEYGFKKAKKAGVEIPHWHPHQLRHTRATEVRRLAGIEAAQVSLGHARADVTQVYAEKNLELAMKIARDSG